MFPLNTGDGVSEERVLMLSDAEQEEFERQFSGSVVQFSSLTMDSCIGQGVYGTIIFTYIHFLTQIYLLLIMSLCYSLFL